MIYRGIPIQNLFAILCYSWQFFESTNRKMQSSEESDKYENLLAKALLFSIEHIESHGWMRGYQVTTEETSTIRGKIGISASLQRGLFRMGRAQCEFDDLTHDTSGNQIVINAINTLLRLKRIDESLRKQLQYVLKSGPVVSPTRICSRAFYDLRIPPHFGYYQPAINICRFIYDSIIPTGGAGDSLQLLPFFDEPKLMWKVFETFVRNFYRYEVSDVYQVKSQHINWNATSSSGDLLNFLPMLKTDTSMISKDRHIIIETKFTADSLRGSQHNEETLRSGHLYQLLSYLENIRRETEGSAENLPQGCPEGILLYPEVGKKIDFDYEIWGYKVRVRSILLDQPWERIRNDLLELVA